MELLLIGNSNICRNRVLPALSTLNISRIDVASLTRNSSISLVEGVSVHLFDDYDIAMAQSDAGLVYISTHNSKHAEWTEKALRRGFHVIVDKPAFTSLDETKRLVDLAHKRKRCLSEATVYAYHPQIDVAKKAFDKINSRPTRLTATFSFPPLAADNFRYKKELGGGAMLDLGAYAVTPGRLFFGEEPQEIFCRIGKWGDEVETSFSILATYGAGRSMVGHFGFNTGYHNRLEILGPHLTVIIDRVFTTPADLENVLVINQDNKTKDVKVPAADNFAIFLHEVFRAIETGQHESLSQNILSDATVLHRLRQASAR